MNRHALLVNVKDQNLRIILQDLFDKSQSAQDVLDTIGSASFTINESVGGSGEKIVKLNDQERPPAGANS